MKWGGTVEVLGPVDCQTAVDWIGAIPFNEWPQQHAVDGQLRPAMISDPSWHGFGGIATGIVDQLPVRHFRLINRMLSVVMPGHDIAPHKDTFDDLWIQRVHVPLVTNLASKFMIEETEFQMEVGLAYRVNISRMHSVCNNGCVPRIHFMFDCYAEASKE